VSVPLNNLTDTWNASGTTFTAIRMNVTATAYAAASKLLDLQTGGVSQFNVDPIGSVTVSNATTTVNDPILNLAQTWNASGVTFTGILVNITQTAYATGSKIADFQAGGATAFSIIRRSDSGTTINIGNTSATGNADFILNSNGHTYDIAMNTAGTFGFYDGTSTRLALTSGSAGFLQVASDYGIGWSNSSADATQAADTKLFRDAANTIAERNGTSAQTFRVYNTYTDSLNYERGIFDWAASSNRLTIGTQASGTGTPRDLYLQAPSANIVFDTGSAVNIQNATGTSSLQLGGSTGYAQGPSAWRWGWTSGNGNGTLDTAWSRIAAGVVGIGNGTAADITGFFQWGGLKRVSGADVTWTSNTTITVVSGLNVTVAAGRTYAFEAHLSFTCAAAGGIQCTIGGTCTATAIIYDGWIVDSGNNGIKGNAQATAMNTVVASSTIVGTAGTVIIKGLITVNAGGALTVRAAQNTSNATATAVKIGSYFKVHDVA